MFTALGMIMTAILGAGALVTGVTTYAVDNYSKKKERKNDDD